MSTLTEIENAISELRREDFFRLVDRLREKHVEFWDKQMEEDSRAGGPLDKLAEEAIAEYRSGRTIPLP